MTNRARNRIIIGSVIAVILVVSIVVIATLPGGAKALDLSATLSEITGVVEVRNSNQGNYNSVNDGYILKMVQQLQTQQQSKVRLDLSSGSIVRLGQSTVFSLAQTQAASNSGLSLLTMQLGKMWIVLKGGAINVNTPGGLASVRGSYMSVWVDAAINNNFNIITVMCLEGHCAFQNNAGTVQLTSAQKVISTDPNVLPVVQPMDMSDIQSWLDNCPESAAIIPSIMYLIATSTSTITPTPTATATVTLTPTPTPTPYGWVNSMTATSSYKITATYSYYLTATAVYGTGTSTSTATPTTTLPYNYQPTSTPTRSSPRATATKPPAPAPTATKPPAPTATRGPYP